MFIIPSFHLTMHKSLLAVLAGFGLVAPVSAQVYITEWMYDTSEFVEFTNVGASAVDLSGWTFVDAGTLTPFSLTPLGTLAAGESFLLTQADAAAFRTTWGLDPSVKVLSYGTGALQRADSIFLYNDAAVLVDRLDYGDNTIGGPRTNTASGWTEFANLGQNTVSQWVLSTSGDAQNSFASTGGNFANPGTYVVPEPASAVLVALGAVLLGCARRRKA